MEAKRKIRIKKMAKQPTYDLDLDVSRVLEPRGRSHLPTEVPRPRNGHQ